MLSLLFTGDGIPERPRFVGYRTTRFVHFRGSNHIPPPDETVPFHSETEAMEAGYHKCPLCYQRFPTFSGFAWDQKMGAFIAASVREQVGPPITDTVDQERFQQAGRAVLEKWPLPLKGYRYRFVVVDSDVLDAMAAPGGHVFITKALLDSMETEEELEAVLAHEIAHVEMRHGWRQYRSAQKASIWKTLAVIGVAVATKSREWGELANSLSTFAASIVLAGYGRGYEEESDSLAAAYFEVNQHPRGLEALERVLSKLQYGGELLGSDPEGKGGLFASHPGISDRILKARNSETGLFGNTSFEGLTAEGEVAARVNFQMQRYYPRNAGGDTGFELIALIDTTPALGKKEKIKDIVVTTERGQLKLDNKEDVEVEPGDSVGAVFITNKQQGLIEQITGIQLKLKNVKAWHRVD